MTYITNEILQNAWDSQDRNEYLWFKTFLLLIGFSHLVEPGGIEIKQMDPEATFRKVKFYNLAYSTDKAMQIRIDTVFESYYQEMYRVIESMTRISVPIIDEYGKEYHFAPSRHFCAMRPRLLDGGVDAE